VLAFAATRIANQFSSLAAQVSESIDELRGWLVNGPLHLSDQQLSALAQRLQNSLASGQSLASRVLGTTTLALEVLGAVVLTVLLTFFLLKDGPMLQAWVVEQVSEPGATRLRAAGRAAWATLTGYVRGVATIGLFNAVFIGIGLVVVGVPLVPSLALLTFVGAFLPLIGALTAGLLSALVALVSRGPVAAVIVVGITLAVHQVEAHVLQPAVMSRVVGLHPVVVLLTLAAGGVLGGVVGAFLAVPTVAVVAAAVGAWRSAADPNEPRATVDRPAAPGEQDAQLQEQPRAS
jgi:predicted PurR-regulated permease PerM